jgi:hypothetical protein
MLQEKKKIFRSRVVSYRKLQNKDFGANFKDHSKPTVVKFYEKLTFETLYNTITIIFD